MVAGLLSFLFVQGYWLYNIRTFFVYPNYHEINQKKILTILYKILVNMFFRLVQPQKPPWKNSIEVDLHRSTGFDICPGSRQLYPGAYAN